MLIKSTILIPAALLLTSILSISLRNLEVPNAIAFQPHSSGNFGGLEGVKLNRRHNTGKKPSKDAHDHDHDHGDEHGHDHGSEHSHEGEAHDEEASQCSEFEGGYYDLNLHIGAVFIVLALSTIGCLLAASPKVLSIAHIPSGAIEAGRHFGTGVILSTALIHMFTGAYGDLTGPCVPEFFQSYTASAGFFAMVAALSMHLIEFVVVSSVKCKFSKAAQGHPQDNKSEEEGHSTPHDHHHGHTHSLFLETTERKISTYILEFGIATHSIFIGLSLGLASGPEFIPLLVAITIHQVFEGFSLGARIGELQFDSFLKPLMMITIFALTTPVGVAIGIIVASQIKGMGGSYVLVRGLFEAISAGILLYAALVDLIGRDISPHSKFFFHSRPKKVLYFLSLYLGALAMAIVGFWA
jgi:zinc transporter 1/2/3